MANIIAVEGLPKLHTTPLASITCISPKIIVEADDENESHIRLTFEPYQALRITTFDCFSRPDGKPIIPQTVMEIQNSTWIDELRNTLKLTDCDADFLDNAKHYLLPLEDDFLEVVSWSVEVESIG